MTSQESVARADVVQGGDWLNLPEPSHLPDEPGFGFIADKIKVPQRWRGEVIDLEYQIGDTNTVRIRASTIRKERTGIHAKLQLYLNGIQCEWDNFNVERSEYRQRLVNRMVKGLSEDTQKVVQERVLRLYLDSFCFFLWEIYLSQCFPEDLEGDVMAPVSFLLQPYLIEDAGAILIAPPGRGKSYAGILMATSVDAGCNEIWQVQQAPVLFVNLERSSLSLQRRIGQVNTALGLEPNRSLATLNARGRSLVDVHDRILRYVEYKGVKLVVLDSLSRSGSGSLIEDRFANVAMDMLNNLQIAWLALAHTPRGDESHVFGSTMFDAAADVIIRLRTQEASAKLGIGLEITKANDIPKRPAELLAYEFDDWGLQAVRHASQGEFIDIEATKEDSPSVLIEEVLTKLGKMSVKDICDETGLHRNTVWTYLRAMKGRFGVVGKEGKTPLYGALAK